MPEFSVRDVTCDGAHFKVTSQLGDIEGHGVFRQGGVDVGGIISGTVKAGPERFLNCSINIRVDGDVGVCYIP